MQTCTFCSSPLAVYTFPSFTSHVLKFVGLTLYAFRHTALPSKLKSSHLLPWDLLLRDAYPLKMKYQISIKRKAIPKKQPKKINAVLKKGPKKFFHRFATFSGVSLAVRYDTPRLPIRDVPQLRQNLSS
jgi:hypothetical protein